jgi:hypothetical protein
MAIEFVPSLGRKSTIMTVTGAWQFTQPSTAITVDDFPCTIQTMYFHPGLNAIMYFMEDGDTLIIKADKTLPLGADMCTSKLLFTTNTWGQYSVKLASAIATKYNFKVTSILDNWAFFNNEMYVVVYGRSNSFGPGTLQSMIVRVQIALPAGQVPTVTLTQLYLTFGTLDQIATLELYGFAFTLTNTTGVNVGQINTASYASFLQVLVPAATVGPTTSNVVRWNLY